MRRVVLAIALVACGGGDPEEGGAPPGDIGPGDTAAIGEAPEEPMRAGETVSGRAVYSANCATCHGEDGRGQGPAAIGLEPPPADFTDNQWKTGDGSLAAIKNTIENGSPGTAMIGWKGTLTQAEIDAVAEHVQSFAGGSR